MPEFVTVAWNTLFFQPMLNFIIVLYGLLFHNFGLTVLVFTVLIRLAMLPFTLKQLRATKAMSRLQPELSKLQKRFGDDKQKLTQAQMQLYKEYGVNPLGCAVPTIIQFPIWIGLYQSIQKALGATPQDLMDLSRHLYSGFDFVQSLVPLESRFLWLDLGQPDPLYVFPVLVGGSMWFQQKMATMPTQDPKQQQMNSMMQWMMPIMFGYFTVSFSSGLALYWFVSNVISMVIQYFVTGWGSLTFMGRLPAMIGIGNSTAAVVTVAVTPPQSETAETRQINGKPGNKRQNRRRGR
ncbi:MAG: membrane protein insertase YidC [Dehalococcoidia bacterium]|nr:membrane protein insertase YidC [Dehalococcoidia bacterium]